MNLVACGVAMTYTSHTLASTIAYVRNVKNRRASGYVTKYLTTEVMVERRGKRELQRKLVVPVLDVVEGVHNEQGGSYVYRPHLGTHGQAAADRLTQTVEVVSRARHIRYTRNFFLASTLELRARIFVDLGNGEIALSREGVPDLVDEGQGKDVPTGRPSWTLFECAPFSQQREDYEQRRAAVEESLDGCTMENGSIRVAWSTCGRHKSCYNKKGGDQWLAINALGRFDALPTIEETHRDRWETGVCSQL